MAEQRTFNLLKPTEEPATIWDKIYEWILTRARVVILVTELLIAVAFVGKVIVDTTAKSKDQQIDTLKSTLAFYATEKEPQFRDIQKKTTQYSSIWGKSSDMYDIVNEIYSYIQNPGAQLTIRIDGSNLSILGTEDLTVLQNLEGSLKTSKTFSGVEVKTLSLEQKDILQSKGSYVLNAIIVNPLRGALPN